MTFGQFTKQLGEALSLPLPGMQVHLRMTSDRRLREALDYSRQVNPMRSSVLILLYPGRIYPEPTFVVILRPTYDGVHSGQISLPGGRFEKSDDSLMKTALREAREEIGVDPSSVTIIGHLTELYIPPSNFLVQPYVGYTSAAPVFRPQEDEVDRIIEIPVRSLLDEKNIVMKDISAGGVQFTAPAFGINDTTIWGATAMILNELKEILLRSDILEEGRKAEN